MLLLTRSNAACVADNICQTQSCAALYTALLRICDAVCNAAGANPWTFQDWILIAEQDYLLYHV